MIPLLEENREKIAEICRNHHVRRLSVFGSAVRDDFDPERSDVDFLVEFSEVPLLQLARNYFSLAHALTDLLHRKVDLVEPQALKNSYLRAAIEGEERQFYAA
jgi:hypothetical protein